MAFVLDETYLPATLTVGLMTDDAFADLCAEHPDLAFEMTAHGELIVMPPNFTLTGARNNFISGKLLDWALADKRGLSFDSSSGWKSPNGARRSADAAWIDRGRIQNLAPGSLGKYWPICPDFVVELRSPSDRLRVLRDKMAEWLANGAPLGWLIDPETRSAEIYRPGHEPELRTDLSRLTGEGPVAGFVLDLLPVWDPLA